ncbi:MAG: hypothetical protein HN392_05170 [Anaerolineae bacterium]|jgi:hypothetical protein|nr:hypothetical protein [Anaerolineae bacterium]MBT7782163.1 hypothetical protein [Anaerolineae bacterium]
MENKKTLDPAKFFFKIIISIIVLPIIILIIYFLVTTIDLRSAEKRFGWEPYISENGNFTILMPELPSEKKSGNTHIFISRDKHFTYFLSYEKYSEEYINYYTDYLLNEFQNNLISEGGTIVINEDIAFDGHLGRKFRIRESDGRQGEVHPNLIEGRVYKIYNRIYLIYIKYPLPWALSDEIEAYLNSFEILD